MAGTAEKKKAPRPPHGDERQAFRGTTRIRTYHVRTRAPDNGGAAVPLSGAAPGRTKRHDPGRLAAGDPPSLGDANSLFSRSTHCNHYLYHTIAGIARGKTQKNRENSRVAFASAAAEKTCWEPDLVQRTNVSLQRTTQYMNGGGMYQEKIVKIDKNLRKERRQQVGFSRHSCEKCRILKIPSKYH